MAISPLVYIWETGDKKMEQCAQKKFLKAKLWDGREVMIS